MFRRVAGIVIPEEIEPASNANASHLKPSDPTM
jgi:hypothetical protein